MGAEVRNLYVVLSANIAGFGGQMVAAGRMVSGFGDEVMAMSTRSAQAVDQIGRTSGRMALGATAALGTVAAAAVQWESQFAGVEKTVDGTAQQLGELEGQLRDMATSMPATHQEIAATAEAAGQLGIATGDIADFTRVMVMMGASTNLSSEDAATSIAQFMNVMQSVPSAAEHIGNTIVDLGNKGASTEAQITNMAQRVSGAGQTIGASEADVLGLAAAMANLGIQSELGAGAAQRVLLGINTNVASGTDDLEEYGKITGQTAQEFAAAWRGDPIMAFNDLLTGLGDIQAKGGNVVGVLDSLGIKGTQNLNVMTRLIGSGGAVAKTLEQSRDAWDKNTALEKEYEKRAATNASQIIVSWNKIKDAAISLGGNTLPVIGELADVVGTLADAFGDLPDPIQQGLVGLLAMTALVGGGAWFGSKVISGVRDTGNALKVLTAEGTRANAMMTSGQAAIGKGRAGFRSFVTDLEVMASTAMTAGAQTERSLTRVAAARERVMAQAKRAAVVGGKAAAGVGGIALLSSGMADASGVSNTASLALMGSAFGPWGTALGAMSGAAMDASAANDELSDSLATVQSAADDLQPNNLTDFFTGLEDAKSKYADFVDGINEAQGNATWMGLLDPGNLENLKNPGQYLGAAKNAIEGIFGESDVDEAKAQLEELAAQGDRTAQALSSIGESLSGNAIPLDDFEALQGVAERIQPALDSLGLSLDDLSGFSGIGAQAAVKSFLAFSESGAGQTAALSDAIAGLGDDMTDTASQADQLKDALDQLLGTNLSLAEAQDGWKDGLRGMREAMDGYTGDLRANNDAASNARGVLRSQVSDIGDVLNAMAQNNAGPEKIATSLQRMRNELIQTGIDAGLSGKQVRAYVNEMGLTPKMVSTIFETLGLDKAEQDTRDLVDHYNALPKQVRTNIKANGIPKTDADMKALQARYNLTPKQVQTLLDAKDNASVKIDGVTAKVKKYDRSSGSATVSVDDQASWKLGAVMGQLIGINGYHASASVTVTTNRVTVSRNVTAPSGKDIPTAGGANGPGRMAAPSGDVAPRAPVGGPVGRERVGRESGGGGTTTITQRLPDVLTLEVDGDQFTAYVRGHASEAAMEMIDAGVSSADSSGRMGWA